MLPLGRLDRSSIHRRLSILICSEEQMLRCNRCCLGDSRQQSFNPHLLRRADATSGNKSATQLTLELSILICSEEQMLPRCSAFVSICRDVFQSSSAPKSRCYRVRSAKGCVDLRFFQSSSAPKSRC